MCQCSHWRASAYVGGPNLLTWYGIYQVVYDSTVLPGAGKGVYMEARAYELTESRECSHALACLRRRGWEQPLSLDMVIGATLRGVYKAVPENIWISADDEHGLVYMRFIRKPLHSFLDSPFQDIVNRGAGHVQVARNRRDTPALSMETDHGLAALFRCAHLGIAGELPLRALWRRAIRKHRFHCVMRRTTPIKLDGTNRRDLSISKVCIFGYILLVIVVYTSPIPPS